MLTVNYCYCRTATRSVAFGSLICIAALALPIRAQAQFTGSASATAKYESNSNVFDLESGVAQPGTNNFRRDDTYFSYGAAFDGNYLIGRQQLYATANAYEYDYQHFKELNHDDYLIDAGWIWKLSDALDGKLNATRTHSMVPFYDLSGASVLMLSLMTEQRESFLVDLKLNSNWKVEGSAYSSKIDQPIPQAPNLQLTQNSGTTSIEYLGFTGLTSGLTVSYVAGDYTGSNGTIDPTFTQLTASYLAKYKSARATLDGQIGYSRRNSTTGINSTSGVTGLFDVKYQLTPKTVISAKIDRAINSYFLNSGSEIDTEANVEIDWQTTYKLAVSVGYTFSYRDFPGQGNNPVGADRVDIQETPTLALVYKLQRWLFIRPYAIVQTRRSTFIGGHYSSNIYGVSVTVTPYNTKR